MREDGMIPQLSIKRAFRYNLIGSFYKDYKKMSHTESEMDEKQKEKLLSKLSAINEKLLKSELITPNRYYIDLDFIRDSNLGCLLSMISEQPLSERERLYKIFLSGLKAYQLRMFDDITRYFPGLPFTQEEFDHHLHNPEKSEEIFDYSPMTEYPHAIKANLEVNINHSQVAEKWKDIPIPEKPDHFLRQYEDVEFVINTYPLTLTKAQHDRIGHFFTTYFGVSVRLISIALRDLPVDLLKSCDDITLKSLPDITDNDAVFKGISEGDFIGKYIHIPLIFKPEVRSSIRDNEQLKKLIERITDQYRIFCIFNWIPSARFAVDLSLFDDGEDKEIDPMAPLPSLR